MESGEEWEEAEFGGKVERLESSKSWRKECSISCLIEVFSCEEQIHGGGRIAYFVTSLRHGLE